MAKFAWSHSLVWASLATALAGCSSVSNNIPPRVQVPKFEPSMEAVSGDLVPRFEPASRSGNPDTYVVFGRRYRVKETSAGYREQGIASWYGRGFHGRKTSSGPRYNMFDLTAAHKSLPLPTYVRVTNLENGRNVVVKVNDRGPFVGRRIIDLSYAAATRLDMLGRGTAQVEIVALEPYQFLPELAARRAGASERLANRQIRPEPKSEPAAISFAHELSSSQLSVSEPTRLALAADSAEKRELPASRTLQPEQKPESAGPQRVREEPKPLGPPMPQEQAQTEGSADPLPEKAIAGSLQPQPTFEVAIPPTSVKSPEPEAPVLDVPASHPAVATKRNTKVARAAIRPATPAVVRAAPKPAAVRPVVAKPAIKNVEPNRTQAPIHLASAEAGKSMRGGEARHTVVPTANSKNSRSSSATVAERRDGRPANERAVGAAQRDLRKGTGSAVRQGMRTPTRAVVIKPTGVRLASLKTNRSRVVAD